MLIAPVICTGVEKTGSSCINLVKLTKISRILPFVVTDSIMSIIGNCNKCALPIHSTVHAYTVCQGICAKPFHCSCVSLSDAALSMLSGNILWMCDGCLPEFYRYRERKSVDAATDTNPTRSIEAEIMDLKSTVAHIVATLAERTQKHRPLIPQSSSPVSAVELHGTDESANENERSEESALPSGIEECSSFSLYLSRIHNCATENDVSQLVSRSLGAPLSDCLNVVKLVPQWKAADTLEYISFKVELNKKWKPLALNATIWPRKVKFREFVNRLNETWKPN